LELIAAIAHSALRMFVAYLLSVLVALLVGIPMGRNDKVEKILYPVIDVLQSVPILGFFPLIIALFLKTLPPTVGLELSSIFLIFTSQAWNLILGVYANVKFIPPYILDVASVYKFNLLTRITKIYIPAAIPAIAKNSIISWAGGLFFLVSSEIITMGSTNFLLEGVGTYVQLAVDSGNFEQIVLGILSVMILSITSYIFIWNPFYAITSSTIPENEFVPKIDKPFRYLWILMSKILRDFSDALLILANRFSPKNKSKHLLKILKPVIFSLAVFLMVITLLKNVESITFNVDKSRISYLALEATEGIAYSLLRIATVLIVGFFIVAFSSYLLYERKTMFRKLFILFGEILSSIPASLWWPMFILLIEKGFPPLFVSLFIIFQGAIWYIFFNIALTGVGPIERNLMEMAKIYRIKDRYKFFNIYVPMLVPYILSGMSSAWGGAWNASIVAEYATLGTQLITFFGIGYLISQSTVSGDMFSLIIYIITLTSFIVLLNRTLWAWLYSYSRKKYHIIE
jgi:NitT/TauT family transport system permease protein